MIEAPISEDMEYDSDYLDEFHGRDAEKRFMLDFEIDLDDEGIMVNDGLLSGPGYEAPTRDEEEMNIFGRNTSKFPL
jgi:hypothetical protein